MATLRECAGGGGLGSVSVTGCITGDGLTTPISVQLQPLGGLSCGVSGLYNTLVGSGSCTAYSYEAVNQAGIPTAPISPSTAAVQVEVKNDVINFWYNDGSWTLDSTFTGGSGGAGAITYFTEEVDNGNSGTSKTIDFSSKANQKLTLTGNVTLTFTAPPSQRSIIIHFVQDGVGGRTVTLPGSVLGTLTIASGVNAQTVANFYYDGTNYHV